MFKSKQNNKLLWYCCVKSYNGSCSSKLTNLSGISLHWNSKLIDFLPEHQFPVWFWPYYILQHLVFATLVTVFQNHPHDLALILWSQSKSITKRNQKLLYIITVLRKPSKFHDLITNYYHLSSVVVNHQLLLIRRTLNLVTERSPIGFPLALL